MTSSISSWCNIGSPGWGVNSSWPTTGCEAFSQARLFKPDLILLDILLPDLDGLSVCKILRRQPSTKKTPVIFMSALSSEVTKRTVCGAGRGFFHQAAQPGTARTPHCRFAASRAGGGVICARRARLEFKLQRVLQCTG